MGETRHRLEIVEKPRRPAQQRGVLLARHRRPDPAPLVRLGHVSGSQEKSQPQMNADKCRFE
jgi:hypothetical protein